MLKKRVIPTLLFKENVLVKGQKFLSDRPVVNAIESVKIYDIREVDELIFYDILATKKNVLPDYSLVSDLSKECFVPLVIGGGINNLNSIEKLLRAGADKVSINTAAILDKNLLREASREFGSQCIVASLDYRVSKNYKVFAKCGSLEIEKDVFEMSKIFEQSGCGEIILCSIDNDGMQNGYDIDTIHKIKQSIKTPIICSGGCGSYEDMFQLFNKTNTEAAAAASIYHFSKMTPRQAKKYLKNKGINVRT